ncbi:DNA topoisomerase-1 [Jatrophihabitans endophyticus]|uniref:DNA topoisomerase n=1 Tax=Jatrophihabitans endophyticus TaxID=1206085 RepID=A0A1M5KMA5_9ACTN|nr:DNA topoisomerase IB [Jatrophihabitans endophyticus]SHG53942.1 DNA topoisomerase-1 [Jatrophihabitans endophyticus]
MATSRAPGQSKAAASRTSKAADLIAKLHDDPEECARIAKLAYVSPTDPGLTRRRSGKGFTYRDAAGVTVVDVEVRDRIKRIAIPPAWQDVWICTLPEGHILAVGDDDRGRRQYIYHERWRSLRDQLNFYRLIGFAAALPAIRADVDAQLRRRTLDQDRVLGAMLRIIDVAGLRVGNEAYAEENDSYGLTTLTKRHVEVHGPRIDFRFPAKSNKRAEVSMTDAGVARVLTALLERRGRRLFTVDGQTVGSDEVNARLAELSGTRLTAKDFRTWNGTLTAFRHLRDRVPAGDEADQHVLAAIDAASLKLGNTRSVCRAHYVHPDVVSGYTSGELERFLHGRKERGGNWLDADERLMTSFLSSELDARAGDLFT